jgi:hypothetical protein
LRRGEGREGEGGGEETGRGGERGERRRGEGRGGHPFAPSPPPHSIFMDPPLIGVVFAIQVKATVIEVYDSDH